MLFTILVFVINVFTVIGFIKLISNVGLVTGLITVFVGGTLFFYALMFLTYG